MASPDKPRFPILRRAVLAGVAAAIGLGCRTAPALAHPDLVDLKVVDRDTGQPLHVWRHDGRLFVAGEPGRRYSLRVTNHTDGRVLVVMSVDGVNILTGETANYNQRGYIFGAHETYDLTGWRKSETEVATFVFAPLPQSYAARTGRPADVGVIGIAAFREKLPIPVVQAAPLVRRDEPSQRDLDEAAADRSAFAGAPPPPPPPPPLRALDTPAAKPAAAPPARRSSEFAMSGSRFAQPSEKAADKLGTAHGAREWSVSRTVPFERATAYPQTIRQVEYDTFDNLAAAGVIDDYQAERRPRPFPGRPDGQGFVPDPPYQP